MAVKMRVVLTLILSVLVSMSDIEAQSSIPFDGTFDDDADYSAEDIASIFGVPQNSKHYKRLVSGTIPDRPTESPSSGPIVKHLKGQSGVFINTTPEKPIPIPQFRPEDMEEIAKKAVELGNMYAGSLFKGKSLEACTESNIEKVKIGLGKESDDIVFVDTLFIAEEKVPPNATEIFGEGVDIRPYRDDPKNPAFYTSVGYGVTCLPTRVRVTGKNTVRYTGQDAYRNFSKNPNGKGFLHKESPDF